MAKIMRLMSFLLLACVGITALAAIAGSVSIKTSKQDIVNTDRFYTIKISYPSIAGDKGQAFNAEIKKLTSELQGKFIKDLQTPEQLKSIPTNVPLHKDSNELDISYKVMYNQNNKVSIRFTYFMSYFMAAHPISFYKTFNYDLVQNKELNLADMFKPNANYLAVLSNYCQKQLSAKLLKDKTSDAEQIAAGAGPEEKNYQLWNITPKGLLISFDVYSVAPGYAGAQQVLVPNKVLKTLLNQSF